MSLFSVTSCDSGAAGPRLVITAGVHGDEFESIECVHQLLDWVPENLRSGTVVLAPVINEDAFLLGQRTGGDGLDLARTCPGNPAGSLTEQIAHELTELICSADYYIDMHTGGTRFAVYPLAGYPLNPNEQALAASRSMAQAFNLPFVWGTDWRLKGRSMSIACENNIPAIYTEYLGSAQCSPDGVTAYVDGCKNVMGMLGMIEHQQPESRVEFTIEDAAEGSGHMQICNPAPLDGVLSPCFQLGDQVSTGDVLGRVRSMDGSEVVEIIAQQTGRIIVMQTFPMVRQGDATFVIT